MGHTKNKIYELCGHATPFPNPSDPTGYHLVGHSRTCQRSDPAPISPSYAGKRVVMNGTVYFSAIYIYIHTYIT